MVQPHRGLLPTGENTTGGVGAVRFDYWTKFSGSEKSILQEQGPNDLTFDSD